MATADIAKDLRSLTRFAPLASIETELVSFTYVAEKRARYYTSLIDVPISGMVGGLFQFHDERPRKDGHAVILAHCEGGKKNRHVVSVRAMGFDIDGALSANHIAALVTASGFAHVRYSTYSDQSSESKTKDVQAVVAQRAGGREVPITDEELKTFCAKSSKFNHLTNVRAGNGGVPCVDEDGKTYLLIEHDPIDKVRILVFLQEPIPVRDETGVDGYKAIYRGIAKLIFGENALEVIDTTCCNPARLHYLPAKPPSSNVAHFIDAVDGALIDWRPLWYNLKVPVIKQRAVATEQRERLATTPLPLLLKQVAACLSVIPAVGYGIWFKCLAAVFNVTDGSEAGRTLACQWSQTAPDDYEEPDFIETWRSLADSDYSGRRAGMGTLISLAKHFCPDFQLPQPEPQPSASYKRSW